MTVVEKVMHRLDDEGKVIKVCYDILKLPIQITFMNRDILFKNYIDMISGVLLQILIKRGMVHRTLGVQRSMLEKMGRSFVLSVQTPLEEANKYVLTTWLDFLIS